MVYVYCGDIGGGKTLGALILMEDAHHAGRKIFTNIDLLPACPFADAVVRIDTPGYPICAEETEVWEMTRPPPYSPPGTPWVRGAIKPLPDGSAGTGYQYFWEYVPPDALIVIDEGDIHFDSAEWRRFGLACRVYHKQSRKFGHDVVYIVQNVGNLYNRIRSLAGMFIYCEHTYRTFRLLSMVESIFGKGVALHLSRFVRYEFADENMTVARQMGTCKYPDAKKYFGWYQTKQLLCGTDKILNRRIDVQRDVARGVAELESLEPELTREELRP